jgi:hypothetical protein
MLDRMTPPRPSRRARGLALLAGAVCAGVLALTAAPAGAQDTATLVVRYERVIGPAGVLAANDRERAKPLQARAIRTLRASRALLRTFNSAAPGAYPACGFSLGRISVGSFRVSRGASLVRSASRREGSARRARVRSGRAQIAAGIVGVEDGLAQAGACRAQLYAQGAPALPPPGTAPPGGTAPPIFDFL